MSETKTPEMINLYRVENPTIVAQPNGVTSHEDLVGQWFTPDLAHAIRYLRKSTQTFCTEPTTVDGAQLLIAKVPNDKLEAYHVSDHPIASGMDVENDNYILPRDGSVDMVALDLDDTIGDLRGKLGNINVRKEAQKRIAQKLGELTIQ
jgi:hypothetical protein